MVFVFPLDGTGVHGAPCLDSPTTYVEYFKWLVEDFEAGKYPVRVNCGLSHIASTTTLQA
jgi:hypothetical protein